MRMRDTTLLEFDDGEDVDGFAAKCAARAEVANHVLRQDTILCLPVQRELFNAHLELEVEHAHNRLRKISGRLARPSEELLNLRPVVVGSLQGRVEG